MNHLQGWGDLRNGKIGADRPWTRERAESERTYTDLNISLDSTIRSNACLTFCSKPVFLLKIHIYSLCAVHECQRCTYLSNLLFMMCCHLDLYWRLVVWMYSGSLYSVPILKKCAIRHDLFILWIKVLDNRGLLRSIRLIMWSQMEA